MHWDSLGGYEVHWDALGGSEMHWKTLRCTGMLWRALRCSGRLWDTLGGTGMLWGALGGSEIHRDALRCSVPSPANKQEWNLIKIPAQAVHLQKIRRCRRLSAKCRTCKILQFEWPSFCHQNKWAKERKGVEGVWRGNVWIKRRLRNITWNYLELVCILIWIN